MQPKQQRALEPILAGHSVTDIASQVGVRREPVWRWRQDPSFASEVSVRQGQRRQAIHDELDAGVIESVRMLRGLVARFVRAERSSRRGCKKANSPQTYSRSLPPQLECRS